MSTVWETFKVNIHGITTAKHAEVLKSIRLAHLVKELAQLEQEHLLTADRRVLGRIHNKLVEFQDTALTEVQHMGKYATAHFYGEGERPGVVLVGIARPNREKDTIMAIQDEDGNMIMDPERIANWFCENYAALYTSEIAPNLDATLDYLRHIEMPWLSDADRVLYGASDHRRDEQGPRGYGRGKGHRAIRVDSEVL
ncbi:hypothetical protein NDU88_006046 [Pleurodeles waltl]|uniref:Uncharacterized protein n=1 Tax=Pleurodeles waltl TaxID=8319 RepID=A0AAV7TX57_PLEWA|nr:hypothetical protein NDU88_006046 [Pleurodeles waltl]